MAQAQQHGAVLYAGQELAKGQNLLSENGMFTLFMQEDGNFVEYKGPQHTAEHSIWCPDTWRRGQGALLQHDGRLVVLNACGGIEWSSSDKPLKQDRYKLVLQNDGNAVIYDGAELPVWSNFVKCDK